MIAPAAAARRLLAVILLALAGCASPPAPTFVPAAAVLVKRDWKGIFSCSGHFDRNLPAITWKRIPFHQEGDRLTGLYTFTDAFNHRDSVMFSGTLV